MSLDSNPIAGNKILKHKALMLLVAFTLGSIGALAAPYSESEIRSVEKPDEAKIRALRDQETTQFRIALGRRNEANRRADLYFRLAELYLEAYRMTFLQEGRVHENRLKRNEKDTVIDRTQSRVYLKQGIQACNEILRLGIAFPSLDQVYYFLAFNHGELEQTDQSLKYYKMLTDQFPKSSYAAEAFRELGEAALRKYDFKSAIYNFEQGLQRASAESAPRILYKLSWAYYRTRQYDRAINTLKDAISKAVASNERFLVIREEALRDMAIFMTETGRVDEAIQYFKSVVSDDNFYPRILERLGKQYERNAQLDQAIQVYEALLKANPKSESGFRVREKLVELDIRKGKYAEALKRIRGVESPTSGEAETLTAAQNLKAVIRRTATESHDEFRKKGTRTLLPVAEMYYEIYLKQFLIRDEFKKEIPEIQMYLAEVKRELGKAKEAGELYRQVVSSKDSRYAKEAASLWVGALSEAVKKANAETGSRSHQEPTPLEREYIEAADSIQKSLEGQPEAKEAALRAAQVVAGYPASQNEAIERCSHLIEKYPTSLQAVIAARLSLQVLTDRLPKDLSKQANSSEMGELKSALSDFKAKQGLLDSDQKLGEGKLSKMIADLDQKIQVGVIASQEKAKDYSGAAKGYQKFATSTQDATIAEQAYINAVQSYIKAGDDSGAELVIQDWHKRYPKSHRPEDSLKFLATQTLIQGQFEHASKLFETLGTNFGDLSSLLLAAEISESTEDRARAQALWEVALSRGLKSDQRVSVWFQLAKSYEKLGLEGKAEKSLLDCYNSHSSMQWTCGAKLGDLYLKFKEFEKATALFTKMGGQKKVDSPWIGYARFQLALSLEKSKKFEPLELPEATLQARLEERLKFLEGLTQAYRSAVSAGGPWAISALHHLSIWVYQLADELDRVGTNEKAKATLKSITDPLRAKAIQTWVEAYHKAAKDQLLNPVMVEIGDRLADAHVKSVYRAQGSKGLFRISGMPSDGGKEGLEDSLAHVRSVLLKNPKDSQAWVDYGNLLWGSGKQGVAKLAYEQASAQQSKNAAALNNRAVVLLSNKGDEEDAASALEALAMFKQALAAESFFIAAKFNQASLLNYYRIFEPAKGLWEQVKAKDPSADALDGLAVSMMGLGEIDAAQIDFEKADKQGLKSKRFSRVYHQAIADLASSNKGTFRCLDRLEDLSVGDLSGFEKESFERLKKRCLGSDK